MRELPCFTTILGYPDSEGYFIVQLEPAESYVAAIDHAKKFAVESNTVMDGTSEQPVPIYEYDDFETVACINDKGIVIYRGDLGA